jgi:membrane fusion protein (multidrug efflux system)
VQESLPEGAGRQEPLADTVQPTVATAFSGTYRRMVRARLARDAGLIVAAVVLLGGWFAWMVLGRVAVFASAQQMKIESEKLPLRVEVPVEGVVVECSLRLGREVKEGDMLVRLDARSFELQRDQLQAQLGADEVTVSALSLQLGAQQKARNADAELARQQQTAGRAKIAAAQTDLQSQQAQTAITERLHREALASELDMIKANGEAASRRAQAFAAAAQAALDSSSGRVTLTERDVQIAAVEKELASAKATEQIHRASLASAEWEIRRRSVVALADGTLADITPCMPGLAVTPAQSLATLLPHADLHVVSYFRSEDAIGRMRPGQPARLRIDNFPWTQFGTVDAVVDRVGTEPRDGLVRVELDVARPNPSIPLSNGETGSAEVEVERISPWHLVLRMGLQHTSPPAVPAAPAGTPVAATSKG